MIRTLYHSKLILFDIPLFRVIDRMEGEKAKAILKNVEEYLYALVGLRSLPRSDTHYVPLYDGDQRHRDSSYYEGTIWSWLIGAYIDASCLIRVLIAIKIQDRMN